MKTSKPFGGEVLAVTTPARQLPPSAGCLRRGLLVLLCCGSLVPLPASARTRKPRRPRPVPERIAEGQVLNANKQPLNGAVVYLEDPKSQAIKSYLTDNNGHFHFSQLAAQTDYELWAEQNGTQSKHRFISQFSNHTHFEFTLKIDPGKKKLFGFL